MILRTNSSIHRDLSTLFAFADGCKHPEMVSDSDSVMDSRNFTWVVLCSIRNFTLLLSVFCFIQTIIQKTKSKLPSNVCVDFYLLLLIIVNIVK